MGVDKGRKGHIVGGATALLGSMLMFTGVAHGADATNKPRYRLIQGMGYTACEAFLRNLNAFPPEEPAMICEQKIHPSHPEFSLPDWEEMDVQNNLQLIYEIESKLWIFTPIGKTPEPLEEWRNKYQERLKSGKAKPRLRKFVADLNGNGIETLISYEPLADECRASLKRIQYVDGLNGPGGYVFVLRTTSNKLEVLGGVAAQLRADVWLYRNKHPYFLNAHATDEEAIIGLHPVSSRQYFGQYMIGQRCRARVDLTQKP